MKTTGAGHIVLQVNGEWITLRRPEQILSTAKPTEVMDVLDRVQAHLDTGKIAAGYLAYEAAPAFDSHFDVHPAGDAPLAWFGIYPEAEKGMLTPEDTGEDFACGDWKSAMDLEAFTTAVARIHTYIASGDSYQVNLTFPMEAPFSGEPWRLFEALAVAQSGAYMAYLDTGDAVLCSSSPECFFTKRGETLACRPMKGTAARGHTQEEDDVYRSELQHSPKDQAENIMIVDMIRNDLGRIALTGSIDTDEVFTVEKYPTLFQMTSTVTAQTKATLPAIMSALFPCASITGAPKVRTMQIIRELESRPRGVYTGCIGAAFPDGSAHFNVAIRTVQIDRRRQQAVYNTGAGIVWDSDPECEYRECLSKTRVLFDHRPRFKLLETILWEPQVGYFLLPYHYNRLRNSAKYFNIPVKMDAIDQALKSLPHRLPERAHRLGLTVDPAGNFDIETRQIEDKTWHFRVALNDRPTSSDNLFLYHKTTHRDLYTEACERFPQADDVLLWNERGELTESTMANLVLRFGEDYFTPPVSCGLLEGTLRSALIDRETLQKKVLFKDDLRRADEILLINSVRKWITVELVS
jgi:para-aminobenzoate synthetase/4-amino-4-deoxychorismate lyase